jgi:hypothetical protein
MVVGGNSLASDVVITVEPTKEKGRTWNAGARAAAVRNGASGLQGWMKEEAAWMGGQFLKVALSVFVVRAVTALFRTRVASQQAYSRAESLWSHGPQERAYPVGNGPGWHPAESSGASGPTDRTTGNGFEARHAAADNPRYVTTVGGYHLYLHRKVLNPGRQLWPCPVLYVSPCETCSLLEYDGGGRPQCVPLVKLRMVLDGNDGGEDLNEIRQWVRSS